MSSHRTLLAKTLSPKPVKKHARKPGPYASQPDLLRSVEQGSDVTGDQRSKERLLLLFDEKIQGDKVNAEMYTQLQAKDLLIAQLNERLISTAALVKKVDTDSSAAKEKQLKTLLEERSTLAKALRTTEEKTAELERKVQSSEERLEQEKGELEILNAALTEENEAQKAQLQDRAEQIRSAKTDVVDMSAIVQDLTKLNAELNDKIKALNEEMERNNTEHYQAIKKAEQVEEMERELVQTKTELQQLEGKQNKISEEAAAAKDLRELLYRVGKELNEVCAKISVVDHEATQAALTTLDALVSQIRTQATAPKNEASRIVTLKGKVRELSTALEEERRKTARAQASEKAHLSRVESLTTEYERLKSALQEANERFKRRLAPLQEVQDKAIAQRHEFEQKLEKLNSELQRKQTEAVNLNERMQTLKAKSEELRHSEEESRKAARELRLENLQLQSENAILSETANTREQKTREAMNKLTAIADELWRRDNDLLRKETQRLKLQEELNMLKASVQHSQARLKHRTAEDMENVNSRLEEKDKEIAALKRILQGRKEESAHSSAKGSTRDDEVEVAQKLHLALSGPRDSGQMMNVKALFQRHEDMVLSPQVTSQFDSLRSLAGDQPMTVGELLTKASL
jgi:chromosome segregation ATPase